MQTDPVILTFGDSLTASYGLARDAAFPARLQDLLRASTPGGPVRNAGVSGDTTRSALARLPRPLSSLDRRPGLAIVELGANDLIRRIAPVETRANLDAILREFDRYSVRMLLASFVVAVFPKGEGVVGMRHTRYRLQRAVGFELRQPMTADSVEAAGTTRQPW